MFSIPNIKGLWQSEYSVYYNTVVDGVAYGRKLLLTTTLFVKNILQQTFSVVAASLIPTSRDVCDMLKIDRKPNMRVSACSTALLSHNIILDTYFRTEVKACRCRVILKSIADEIVPLYNSVVVPR